MWSNFHTHSSFCDGTSSLQEVVDHALSQKIISLGFSSHAPLPFERQWSMKKEDLLTYRCEIDQLKKSTRAMEIYAGLEVDYIPQVISPRDFTNELDYTLGSIHFVDQFKDGTPWEIDGTNQHFEDGFNEIFNRNSKDAIHRYYELTKEMIRNSTPDIIGHLDKIKIQNKYQTYFDENESWYQQEVQELIKVIKEAGSIVEINTRGLYQKKLSAPYPSPWIIELLYKSGIPIMINSDAHHPADLCNSFSEAAHIVFSIGYKKLRILLEGKWQDVAFDQHGIKLS